MSATNRGAVRVAADNYPTPAACVDRLLERVWLPRQGVWLEPAAGDGAIVYAVNKQRFPTWCFCEIREECESILEAFRPCWLMMRDFLETDFGSTYFDVVITNPPFSLALEFIQKSLTLAPWVVMLLRLDFLGSQKRAAWLRNEMPDVYVLPNRPSFGLNKDGKPGTDSNDYGWYVWPPERGRRSGRVEILGVNP